MVFGGLGAHGEEIDSFGEGVIAGGDGVDVADHDEGVVAGVVGLHQHVRKSLGPERAASLIDSTDRVVVCVDEVWNIAHFREMPHLVMKMGNCRYHFITELERERIGGEVPKLDAAIAVTIHALLHSHYAKL